MGAPVGIADPVTSIVVELVDGSSVEAVIARTGIEPTSTFEHTLTGFVADVNGEQLARLRREPSIVRTAPNLPLRLLGPTDPAPTAGLPGLDVLADTADPLGLGAVTALLESTLQAVLSLLNPPPAAPSQTITNAVRRSGALDSPTAGIDGVDERVDATIALVDTGIDRAHPDLNVVGGTNCTTDDTNAWQDDYGHGTLVGGVAAALDNGFGVVGVAPGARLLAAKAVDADGFGTTESLLCAIEWAADPAQAVDVINISLGWPGTSDQFCGVTDEDVIHSAICSAVAAGITVVAGAGNGDAAGTPLDAGTQRPASYPEVITVSGLADFDGRPGGLSGPTSCGPQEQDDHMWSSSNFGTAVDIAASAVCVVTTLPGGTYGQNSGTSLAGPAVAGGAALVIDASPTPLSPATVRGRLLTTAESGPIPGDLDQTAHEGILDVSGF
jgi:subtilisin family serine protease